MAMHTLVFQALGMKVVNIVPAEMVDVAKSKMICALDWNLQRWNEEGNVVDDDEIDVEAIIERAVRRKSARDQIEQEEEEVEEDEVSEEEEDPVVDLGESEEEEEEDIDEEDDDDEEAMEEAMNIALEQAMEEAEEEAFNFKTKMTMAEDMSPSPSPQREERDEGQEPVVGAEPEQSSRIPVGSFSSGIPSTPGRGFVHLDTSRRSEDQQDVQPMEESEGDERPQPAEIPQLDSPRSTSRPTARKKVKAPRKGSSNLRPSKVGEQSRSSEAMEHSGLDREVESGQVQDVEEQLVDAIMSEAVHEEVLGTDLNVTSPVEEVAAAVLEVGQGRSQRDSPGVVVDDTRM